MENEKKRRLMIVIILVAIVLITIGGTYAYFLTQIGRNEEEKLTIKTGTLALTFEDNDEGLTANMELGKSYSKEFRIRNTGTEAVTTNMIWSGLVNTYIEESLSYTLEYKTVEDGDWQTVETSHTNVPQSYQSEDYNLATGLTIPANTTYYYRVTITFNNLPDVNQESDKSATLSTKFKLGEEVIEESSAKTLNRLKLTTKNDNPTFANVATTDETSDGLYSLEDDYGTSYYYRGAVENNYLKFGGFYWRIIRINGDGSIRMQYDGTQGYTNAAGGAGSGGANRYTHTVQKWNTNSNDNKYVGWMYGITEPAESTSKEEAQTNTIESNIKKLVDLWYKANIIDKKLSKYVSDEIFCNDRTTPGKSKTGYINDTGLGYGNNITAYGGTSRLGGSWQTSVTQPKFICEQKNDAFTVSDTTKGNGALTYPAGLITADEVVAAGSGKFNTSNRYYYLYKNNSYWYWSLSPHNYNGSDANVFIISSDGNLSNMRVYGNNNSGAAIAPVINISSKYAKTLVGSGTIDSPYQISGIE